MTIFYMLVIITFWRLLRNSSKGVLNHLSVKFTNFFFRLNYKSIIDFSTLLSKSIYLEKLTLKSLTIYWNRITNKTTKINFLFMVTIKMYLLALAVIKSAHFKLLKKTKL